VVWGGMLTNFCYGYFTFYCMTWMPAYLVENAGFPGQIGRLHLLQLCGHRHHGGDAGWAADR
jgi:hypothetical protein